MSQSLAGVCGMQFGKSSLGSFYDCKKESDGFMTYPTTKAYDLKIYGKELKWQRIS